MINQQEQPGLSIRPGCKIKMTYIGIDVGTSSLKAVLIDDQGNILGSAVKSYELHIPKPGWSQQHPEDWWEACQQALQGLRTIEGFKDVRALGVTGQMHGSVFLDVNDRVLYPAILWNDQRTSEECQIIEDKVGFERLVEITGNPPVTGFQAPKILWLRRNFPELYSKVRKILLPKDYIRLCLTGEYATDVSDASGTLLLDLRSRDWSREVLEKLDLDFDLFPKVYESPEITGFLKEEIAESLGISKVPVIAGGGDNAAGAIGTGIISPGLASSSIGTSGVVLTYETKPNIDTKGRVHSFGHTMPGSYSSMAVTLAAGASFNWLRDLFDVSPSQIEFDDLTQFAEEVPPGSEGLLFLPYLTGERTPHLDPFARGAFVGLTSRHNLGHIARAVLEGVVFSLKEGLDIILQNGGAIDQVRLTGGGGKSKLWSQLQSTIFNLEAVTLKADEGPAYGAAILAMSTDCGVEGIKELILSDKNICEGYQPNPHEISVYQDLFEQYKLLYPSLKETMHKLTAINKATFE